MNCASRGPESWLAFKATTQLHTCATGYRYCSGKKHLLNFRCLLLGEKKKITFMATQVWQISKDLKPAQLYWSSKRTENPQCSRIFALSDVLFVLWHEVTALFDIQCWRCSRLCPLLLGCLPAAQSSRFCLPKGSAKVALLKLGSSHRDPQD